MRAILIEEERFTDICNIMHAKATSEDTINLIVRQYNVTPEVAKGIADELARTTRFWFIKWAQSHGASCTR